MLQPPPPAPPQVPSHYAAPSAPSVAKKSRWSSAKSLVNIGWSLLWIAFICTAGFLINLYAFGGVNFDSDFVSSVWMISGIATVYGGAVISAVVAQVLILKKDTRWLALVPLWLFSPVAQVFWVLAFDWAGSRYGFICC